MRDFPVFSTENGVGSLVLKEIPYSGNAYIQIQSSQAPEAFIKDCLEFCRIAGAKHVYASGTDFLEKYPFHTAIWKMTVAVETLPQWETALFPVTDRTSEQWRCIYNEKMRNVPNSGFMSILDMKQLCKEGTAYFVHEQGELIGIGKASWGKLEVVISMIRGGGERVVSALAHGICGEQAQLEVASTNEKAVALYERLGFVKCAEISRWYHVHSF